MPSNGRGREIPAALVEILELVEDGYQGQIVLHCDGNGNIVKYNTNQTHTPRRGTVDLREVSGG